MSIGSFHQEGLLYASKAELAIAASYDTDQIYQEWYSAFKRGDFNAIVALIVTLLPNLEQFDIFRLWTDKWDRRAKLSKKKKKNVRASGAPPSP